MTQDRRPPGGVTGLPFDDVREVLKHFPTFDRKRSNSAAARLGALGAPGRLAAWLAGWRQDTDPLARVQIDMFISLLNVGGDEVDDRALHAAQDMLANVAGGGHSMAQIALAHGAGLKVYDLALELPTGDILAGPAMDERECAGAMAFGMEGIAGGVDVVGVARAGEGADIGAAAILLLLMPDLGEEMLDAFDGEARTRIAAAADAHAGVTGDPFELLRRLGSRDMAAIAGLVMAARTQSVPVVLAGLECLAVAALLARAGEGNLDHCLAGHRGRGLEAELVDRLGLMPVLNEDAGTLDGVAVAAALGALKTASAAAAPLLRGFEIVDAE